MYRRPRSQSCALCQPAGRSSVTVGDTSSQNNLIDSQPFVRYNSLGSLKPGVWGSGFAEEKGGTRARGLAEGITRWDGPSKPEGVPRTVRRLEPRTRESGMRESNSRYSALVVRDSLRKTELATQTGVLLSHGPKGTERCSTGGFGAKNEKNDKNWSNKPDKSIRIINMTPKTNLEQT